MISVSKPMIRTVMTWVTPAMAKDWLAKNNEGNRRLRKGDVELLASQISSGTFEATHQGLAFYEDGTLADGQHRLHAVVKADKGVWINVTTGLRREANHKIDKGITRTALDGLHFMGVKADGKRVAVCTAMIYQYQAEVMGRERWHQAKYPGDVYAGFYQRFSPAIEFALAFPAAVRVPAPVNAAVASAWFTQDRERLGEFMLVMETGEMFSEQDRAALRIRDHIKERKYGQGAEARNDLYLRVCSALRYFLAGRNLSRLYATPEHAFPFAEVC